MACHCARLARAGLPKCKDGGQPATEHVCPARGFRRGVGKRRGQVRAKAYGSKHGVSDAHQRLECG
eukprot:478677-Prymnesium_polylepis.1